MYDKLTESTNTGAKVLGLLGAVMILVAILFPVVWYGHEHVNPDASDWSTVWPIVAGVFGFALGIISLAVGYGLSALSAILGHLGKDARPRDVIRSQRSV